MKLPEHRFRALLSEHVLFYTYRWVMWAMAALLVVLLPQLPRSQSFYLSILLVLAALTILATTLAKQYVRLVQHYPLVSLVDVLAGLGIVWISGGLLPFLPYALGGLVLPARHLIQRIIAPPTSVAAPHAQTSPPPGERKYLSCEVNTSNPPSDSLVSKPGERGREPHLGDISIATVETTRQVVPAEMRSAAEQGPQALRQIIYTKLTPGTDIDLPVALDQIVHSFRRSVNMPMQLNRVGHAQKLSPAKHLTLIRLAQEALLNVQQHSHASSASLTLCYEPEMITLTVQDNGVGLLDGTYRRPGVHALRLMYYRLSEFDGNLEVFEGETGGVTVRGTLPLD
jgi:hypothetical protein